MMKIFAFGAALVASIVFSGSVASANSRIASAGTTGQSAMQFVNAGQKNTRSSQQVKPQNSAAPSQSTSVPVASTQQSGEASYKATCMLQPVTAGGQAKVALAAVQACLNQ